MKIINVIINNINYIKLEDKLYTPNSKTKDYNGFNKKLHINLMKNENKKIENYLNFF